MCSENYKTLLEKIKEDLNEHKAFHAHRLKDSIVKIKILLKLIYIFNAIPIKTPAVVGRIDKLILNFICICKGLIALRTDI